LKLWMLQIPVWSWECSIPSFKPGSGPGQYIHKYTYIYMAQLPVNAAFTASKQAHIPVWSWESRFKAGNAALPALYRELGEGKAMGSWAPHGLALAWPSLCICTCICICILYLTDHIVHGLHVWDKI
jgi:hypothetical protein